MENNFSEKLQAFIIYKERGIEAVRNVYPDYMEFVYENKDKSYQEVKSTLIKQQNKNQ
jgi:hypothetical protein